MRRFKSNINHILNTFNKSFGIGALCYDNRLTLISYTPQKGVVDDFNCLGVDQITSFLTESFASSLPEKPSFYTYFLDNNLVCNINFLILDNNFIGAIVTQPMLINRPDRASIESLVDSLSLKVTDKKALWKMLLRAPVITYDKLLPIGEVLSSLIYSFFLNQNIHQILKGGTQNSSSVNFNSVKILEDSKFDDYEAIARHGSFSDYQRLRDSIQNGDVESLTNILNEINAGSVPMTQLNSNDFIRSLKDTFIKVCAMSCYTAIEAKAPYYKTMDLADDFIRQMETLENINDIYELMKSAMLTFTRTVAVSRIVTYSKPVRQSIDYIEQHFSEKITLNTLSKLTGLSPSYLSNIIRKETGLVLMDNINKIRINHSKKYLLDTNLSNSDIALRVGFSYGNHFAGIFKKFTGLTPTEFRKAKGIEKSMDANETYFKEVVSLAYEQIRGTLAMLPNMYDVARIVDPINHKSWIVKPSEFEFLPETCYDFWNRGQSCSNCISTMAYLQNRTFYKIDQQNNNIFLVAAIPKTMGKNTYIIEILKNISNNVYINIDMNTLQSALPYDNNFCNNVKDSLTDLYNRRYIDEKLPLYVRRSKLENKPFSIIMSMLDICDINNEHPNYETGDKILKEYAKVIARSLPGNDDWAGLYIGNVFLIALSNADFEAAQNVEETIEANFKKALADIGINRDCLNVTYTIRPLSEDIKEAQALIHLALLDFHIDPN